MPGYDYTDFSADPGRAAALPQYGAPQREPYRPPQQNSPFYGGPAGGQGFPPQQERQPWEQQPPPPSGPPAGAPGAGGDAPSKVFVRTDGVDAFLDLRIILPNDRFPKINFGGRIIGAKGSSIRKLQEEHDMKIYVNSEGKSRDDPTYDATNDPPHVRLQASGDLPGILRRMANLAEELQTRFDPYWKDEGFEQYKKEKYGDENGEKPDGDTNEDEAENDDTKQENSNSEENGAPSPRGRGRGGFRGGFRGRGGGNFNERGGFNGGRGGGFRGRGSPRGRGAAPLWGQSHAPGGPMRGAPRGGFRGGPRGGPRGGQRGGYRHPAPY